MKEEFIEGIYAGWLAKTIGIRLGAPIEGWTYEKIKNIYGNIDHYPCSYKNFAADDDSNGPMFFLRGLEEEAVNYDLRPQDVGNSLLNYAPFEHGFFWWGGYGVSTEHTAYLNLRNGILAPQSGSIEQNGRGVAEQIGGQIFIDTWGLVTPGNPDLAAKYAEAAASVSHGGNGIYGGIFVAVCISYAFIEKDIPKIIQKGLSYIPEDSEYALVVRAVSRFYGQHPDNWHDCYAYIHENYGYDRYPGNCHIIPNIAVMILALLYGEGSFDRTINICNMCGWDTDCNVGNVATIMGVRNGLADINYGKWRREINDLLICSSVMGSLNIQDIPYGASYIARLAYAVAGQEIPEKWRDILTHRIDSCHFEYPGSTHAIRVRVEGFDEQFGNEREYHIRNTDETAYTGQRALKFFVQPIRQGENIYVYKQTYYGPEDFDDSRYDPSFSPLTYPGQTVHGSALIPEYGQEALACLYVHDAHSGKIYESKALPLEKGRWVEFTYEIPAMGAALIDEMGFCFKVAGKQATAVDFVGMIDDLYVTGEADYIIDFSREKQDVWTSLHWEISQFSRLKGLMYLDDHKLHLSCADFAEAYTGSYKWRDYQAAFALTPLTDGEHYVNVRVQGAMRSYAAGFRPDKKIALLKNDHGYRVMIEADFDWHIGVEYMIAVKAQDNRLTVSVNGQEILVYTDGDHPYLQGAIGITQRNKSHGMYREIQVNKI